MLNHTLVRDMLSDNTAVYHEHEALHGDCAVIDRVLELDGLRKNEGNNNATKGSTNDEHE